MKNNPKELKSSTKKPRARRHSAIFSSPSLPPTPTPELKEAVEENTDNVSESLFQRFKSSEFVTKASETLTETGEAIKNSEFAAKASEAATEVGDLWEKFEETEEGQIFKIGTSVAVTRVAYIVLASLTIAGLLSPASPAVAIAIGAIGLATVVIGVAMDTARTRETRQLQKENDLLVKDRTAKSTQDYILKLEPDLSQILKDELYQPSIDGKKSTTKRYLSENSEKLEVAKGVGKAFLKHGLNIASIALESLASHGIGLIKSIGSFAYSLVTESKQNVDISTVQTQFKKQIDAERNKSDTPGYNNLTELKQATRLQRIQTMALQKLVTDTNYWGMKPEEKLAKFKEIKEEIAKTEKAVSAPTNIFAKGLKTIMSIVKDAGRAHNPFSEYNTPAKVRIEKHSSLTKAIANEELMSSVSSIRESIKRNKSQQLEGNNKGVSVHKPSTPSKRMTL